MVKVLVTGGAGFIGSHVTDALINEGHDVVIIDNLSTGNRKNINKKAKLFKKDINENLSSLFKKEKFDYVYHLAAQINLRKSLENPKEDAETNIIGSLNIINECVKNKVKKIIFSSTGGAIYSPKIQKRYSETDLIEPISPYGIAKFTVENYLRVMKLVHGLDFTILRYSNVYGPRQNSKGEAGVVAIFADNLINNKNLNVFGDGLQTRDFVYVKDVVAANLLALKLKGTYNVSTGREVSVNMLARIMMKLLGKHTKINYQEGVKGELRRSCLSSYKLAQHGWRPKYNIIRGLKETVEWFKTQQS